MIRNNKQIFYKLNTSLAIIRLMILFCFCLIYCDLSFSQKSATTSTALIKSAESIENKIFSAIDNNNLCDFEKLIYKRNDLDSIKYETKSILQYAAQQDKIDFVKALLHEKININLLDAEGAAAMHYAKNAKMTELLINSGAKVNILIYNPKYDDENKLLYVNNCNNITPLFLATKHGRLDVVKLLIKHKADVNICGERNGNTPLHIALGSGNIDIAELLIKNGANIFARNRFGIQPIHLSILPRNKNIFDQRGKIDSYSHEWIDPFNELKTIESFDVIKKKYNKMFQLLIQHGADINAMAVDGTQPIHFASYFYCTDILEILLKKGKRLTNCIFT
jgi:ankyrin repeat protein